jgi:hypothetical protein
MYKSAVPLAAAAAAAAAAAVAPTALLAGTTGAGARVDDKLHAR